MFTPKTESYPCDPIVSIKAENWLSVTIIQYFWGVCNWLDFHPELRFRVEIERNRIPLS